MSLSYRPIHVAAVGSAKYENADICVYILVGWWDVGCGYRGSGSGQRQAVGGDDSERHQSFPRQRRQSGRQPRHLVDCSYPSTPPFDTCVVMCSFCNNFFMTRTNNNNNYRNLSRTCRSSPAAHLIALLPWPWTFWFCVHSLISLRLSCVQWPVLLSTRYTNCLMQPFKGTESYKRWLTSNYSSDYKPK